jgi:hypothetical protein
MSVFAAIRPDGQIIPLLLHVAGAATLVGGLFAGSSVLANARNEPRFLRLGYWTLLAVALPGWILMRIGAAWIYTEQGWDDLPEGVDEPGWLVTGATIADIGGPILLITLIIGGIGVYRLREGKGAGLLRATLVLAFILLLAYVVAGWAMAGKPD